MSPQQEESSARPNQTEDTEYRVSIEARLTALESKSVSESQTRALLGPITERVAALEGSVGTAKTAIIIVVPLVAAAISAGAIVAGALIARAG